MKDQELRTKTVRIVQKVPTAAGAAVGGVEKKRRAHARSYLSRAPQWGHGQELAPASRCLQPLGRVAEVGGTGCCGFTGPIPSATLDKILTRLASTIGWPPAPGNGNPEKNSAAPALMGP